MQFFKSLYIRNLFFFSILGLAGLFTISFFVKVLFLPAQILFWILIGACIWDLLVLYTGKNRVTIARNYPEKMSNGDENEFEIQLSSSYPIRVHARILEEFPIQLQVREQQYQLVLHPHRVQQVNFKVRPTSRGIHQFNRLHVLIHNLGFFERKFTLDQVHNIACYPSFIQLRKYQLLATTNRLVEMGVKRIRKIGATMEFDHIRDYVRGDDYRHLNWKATAKHKKLLVNQYQEEKSQPIYSLIDVGRVMRMPFQGLTLLDYAINASLVLSNAAMLKDDRAGMLTFSKTIANHIAAEKRNNQMLRIADTLYQIKTDFEETDFENLYAFCRKHINKRALLMIYSNFETMDALKRQLMSLKMLAKTHVVVVVVFQNTELLSLARTAGKQVLDIYNQIIAEKFIYEKGLIIQELNRHGIQTIYTAPEHLTINAINKYLEIKARGII